LLSTITKLFLLLIFGGANGKLGIEQAPHQARRSLSKPSTTAASCT
jgi:hypothetical protein